jgi:hypothetical protein
MNVMGRSVVRDEEGGQDTELDLLPNCCGFKEEIGMMSFREGEGWAFILRGWGSFICEWQGSMMLLRSVS